MRPARASRVTASVRDRAASLPKMALTWNLTVSSLTSTPRDQLVPVALCEQPKHLELAGGQGLSGERLGLLPAQQDLRHLVVGDDRAIEDRRKRGSDPLAGGLAAQQPARPARPGP